MQRVWLAVIPGLVILLSSLGILAVNHKAIGASQDSYTGVWRSTDGSGQFARVMQVNDSYELVIQDKQGNVLLSCARSTARNGGLAFTEIRAVYNGDPDSIPYILVKPAEGQISIEGFTSASQVFVKV